MKRYEVIAPLRLNAAGGYIVELNEKQVEIRKESLARIGRTGTFRVTGDTQFKIGEQLGIEGDLPKSLVRLLEDPQEAAARKAKEAQDKKRTENEAAEKKRAADQEKQRRENAAAEAKVQRNADDERRLAAEAAARATGTGPK